MDGSAYFIFITYVGSLDASSQLKIWASRPGVPTAAKPPDADTVFRWHELILDEIYRAISVYIFYRVAL